MRLVRSFPAHPPAGRNFVVDDAERAVNRDDGRWRYSYRALADVGDDLINLDWDVAVSREDLVAFAKAARSQPDLVLIAPTLVYQDSRAGLPGTVWSMRRYEPSGALRQVAAGEPACHLFGFGMLYLPAALIDAFCSRFAAELDAGTVRFDDTAFAGWHHRTVGEAAIDWSVRPVHLHYRISEVPL